MLLLALLPTSILTAARTCARSLVVMSHRPRPQRHLAALAPTLFEELNTAAFDDQLPGDIELIWNPRLRRTAGRCRFLAKGEEKRAEIELSPRVLDSDVRLRATLAHEMCHAAQWIIDGEAHPPHGASFQRWARRLETFVPDVSITTTHSYQVVTRYAYRCGDCGQTYGRHSRMDVRARCCGICGGSLHLLETPSATPSSKPLPPFAKFVRKEYAPLRKRWPRVTHKRIMIELGKKYRRQCDKLQQKGQKKYRA